MLTVIGESVHAFRKMAYLDVEKTGSTYVSKFLRTFLDDEEVHVEKHGLLEDHPPADRLHVISVREPLDLYLSLFSYGCDKRGRVHEALVEAGRGDLYAPTGEAFGRWLDFVLDADNAHFLANRNYARSGCAPFVGLMSFRVARLAMPRPLEALVGVDSVDAFIDAYRKHSVVDEVLHTERLTEDLEAFVRAYAGRLTWKPSTEAAIAELHKDRRVNASNRVDQDGSFVAPEGARAKVLARESLLAEVFGYGAEADA